MSESERNPLARLTHEERVAAWKAALTATSGNVTKAGRALGFPDKRRAFELNERLGLAEFARGLRIANQGRDKGRPCPTLD